MRQTSRILPLLTDGFRFSVFGLGHMAKVCYRMAAMAFNYFPYPILTRNRIIGGFILMSWREATTSLRLAPIFTKLC